MLLLPDAGAGKRLLMGDGGEGRRRAWPQAVGGEKAREGIGEERRKRDWVGFHREAGFVPRIERPN